MKFNQTPKSTFTENFNPPPGYYMGNELLMDVIKIKPPQQQFLKSERFPQDKISSGPEYKTIEGFDKIALNKSLKKQYQNNKIKENNYVLQAQSQVQLHRSQATDKQMKNLLVKQMENCLSQQLEITPPGKYVIDKSKQLFAKLQMIAPLEPPGPGHYDSKVTIIKPRARGAFIKEDSKRTTCQEHFVTADVVYGKQLASTHSESLNTTMNKPKKIKFVQGDDFNLEKLFEKEKKQKNGQIAPPPGHYEIESQFGKIKELNFSNQCFDSREPRFKYINDTNPGPGTYYELQNYNDVGGFVSQLPRQIQKDNAIVPVGTYTIQQLTKPQRKDGQFPSCFGSGQKRMPDSTPYDNVPGPGSYDNLTLKKKHFKYTFKQKDKKIDQVYYNQQLCLTVAHETQVPNNKQCRSKSVSKGQQSSVFSSSVQRFGEKQKNEELGPGSYSCGNQFTKTTFNRGNDLFGKESRINQFKPQEIGPGSYESNYKLLKKNFIRDVHF